jgi:putative ABC transport system ATP-binding protein
MTGTTLPGLRWLLPAPPVIELRGVGRSWAGRPPVTAPCQVDLTVERGELVIVTGQAGAGKTTLLNVIGLLERPTAGRYRLNGIDTAILSERERSVLRAGQIGFVFQRQQLLTSRSVIDNVALALVYHGLRERQRRQRAMDMLSWIGIADRASVVAGQLCDAERQLVAIARAMAGAPSLLLWDEPTATLDRVAAARVIDLLEGWRRDGGTAVIVTRDPLLTVHGTMSLVIGPDPGASPLAGPHAGPARRPAGFP